MVPVAWLDSDASITGSGGFRGRLTTGSSHGTRTPAISVHRACAHGHSSAPAAADCSPCKHADIAVAGYTLPEAVHMSAPRRIVAVADTWSAGTPPALAGCTPDQEHR